MALEVERKFLLLNDDWRAQVSRAQPMRQGYLVMTGAKSSVRVRLEGEKANLNIKAAVVGAARAEFEYEIPLEDAHQMLDTLCVGEINKTRYYIEQDALVWEIDEFHGDNAGLIVAEIELNDPQQSFHRPHWLGQDVTDQHCYYNHALALRPFRSWNASGD